PGKVGHRQVISDKLPLNEVAYLCFVILKRLWTSGYGVPPVRDLHCWRVPYMSQCGESLVHFRPIAGVCVTSRNVAKVSSDFRHEVFLWGGWLGNTVSYAGKYSFGIAASAILSTGDYRAYRIFR
ncbi:MAG TPA: hypothetical protein DEF89_22795, partial [Desulfosporosinus sp.]|nr:hypothetical protein [Desulfosporosinus sp.]